MNAQKRANAVKILSYYFRTVYTKIGLRWTQDNQAELAVAVDLIAESGKEET